jgi:hypothetical protein
MDRGIERIIRPYKYLTLFAYFLLISSVMATGLGLAKLRGGIRTESVRVFKKNMLKKNHTHFFPSLLERRKGVAGMIGKDTKKVQQQMLVG